MAQLAQHSSSYRVEVSGWDTGEAFFSEKTVLCGTAARQEIALSSHLREGRVIFVHLLEPFAAEENFPVPYRVSKSLPLEIDGRVTAAIAKLHPKPSYRQSAATIDEPRANCA